MVTAKRMEQWNHTSQLLAMIHNVQCTSADQHLEPWQFHLFGRKPAPVKGDISELKVFLREPRRGGGR